MLAHASAALPSTPEVRRAIPINQSSPSAGTAVTSTNNSPSTAAEFGNIRLAPIASSDPAALAEAQLAVANGFFLRQQWNVAALEFEKFLQQTTPGMPHRDQALFRLGECERQSGDHFSSQKTYQQLLQEIPSGAMAAAAAYRLAEYYQSRKEIKSAMEAYAQAATLTTDPAIKNAARYNQGRCYEELGEEKKALTLFEEVSKEENPNRDNARVACAETQKKAGHSEEALLSYQAIAHDTSGTVKAEASVQAAILAHELGRNELSQQLFQQAASLLDGGEWSGVASLGLMKLAYEAKDYKMALQKSEQAIARCNLEGRAQALLLAAQAHRQLGEFQKSLPLYDQVLREFPGTETAHEALFARLLALQSLHDPALLPQIEEALLASGDSSQRSKIELLKAEELFRAGNYTAAAAAYNALKNSSLSPTLKADALYKEAWSLSQIGDPQGALGLLSEWIKTNPTSPQMPVALMQRGALEQELKNPAAALTDYSAVIEHYPQTAERELALQQKALLQGEQQDNKGMRATFQELLRSYPATKAEAQANFWIGWSLFEEKSYTEAIPFLEKARELDTKAFGERCGLRLLLAHYYLEQVPETLNEAAKFKTAAIPVQVLQWLGLKAFLQGDLTRADRYLSAVLQSGKPEFVTADVATALAKTLIQEKKFQEAEVPAATSLNDASDPASRSEALLRVALLRKANKNFVEADKLIQEALLLQPEGTLNIQARLLQADILLDQGKKEEAARAYKAASLLTADPNVSVEAARKAEEALKQ